MPLDENDLASAVRQTAAAQGVTPDAVQVIAAEADEWRYALECDGRSFEIGFTRASGAWARERTPGRAKHLTSNDHPPLNATAAALPAMVRLVARAVRDPAFPPRDPPVI